MLHVQHHLDEVYSNLWSYAGAQIHLTIQYHSIIYTASLYNRGNNLLPNQMSISPTPSLPTSCSPSSLACTTVNGCTFIQKLCPYPDHCGKCFLVWVPPALLPNEAGPLMSAQTSKFGQLYSWWQGGWVHLPACATQQDRVLELILYHSPCNALSNRLGTTYPCVIVGFTSLDTWWGFYTFLWTPLLSITLGNNLVFNWEVTMKNKKNKRQTLGKKTTRSVPPQDLPLNQLRVVKAGNKEQAFLPLMPMRDLTNKQWDRRSVCSHWSISPVACRAESILSPGAHRLSSNWSSRATADNLHYNLHEFKVKPIFGPAGHTGLCWHSTVPLQPAG